MLTHRIGSAAPARTTPFAARGFTAVELVAVATIALLLSTLLLSALGPALRRGRLHAASRTLAAELRRLRTEAVVRHRSLGIVFERDRGFRYAVYRDGNGNGIRHRDIEAGIDREVERPLPLDERFPGVAVAILPPPPIPLIPPRHGILDNLDDPVKFGASDIISCAPAGTCSSGTVYLSSGAGRMAAVRLRGWNAQVHLWDYVSNGRRWQQRGQ